MRLDRSFYIPPDSRKQVIASIPGSEIHRYEVNDKPYAMVFGGRRSKPDFHFSFMKEEQREAKIQAWIEGQESHVEYQKEHRARQNTPHEFEVGQLFYHSWGYDQTNIDYYELVELKGKCMGKVVPICSKTISSNPPQEMVGPSPGSVRDWDVIMGIGENDTDKFKWKKMTEHGFSLGRGYSASPCDADCSRYETSSGWGH